MAMAQVFPLARTSLGRRTIPASVPLLGIRMVQLYTLVLRAADHLFNARQRTESIWFWIWIWSPLDSGVQSKSDSPLDSDSWVQIKSDSSLDSDSWVQSKSDSSLDSDSWVQIKSDSSLLGLGLLGPKQIGLLLGLGLPGPKQIGLLLGLGLLACSGCGFGGRAPPPLSRPSAWERAASLHKEGAGEVNVL
jgi:hypothetical protein